MKSACKYTHMYIILYICPQIHICVCVCVCVYIYKTYRESERITERKKRKQILRPTYRTPECILIMN